MALFAVRESRDETVERTVDIPGVLTLTTGLAALVLALVEGNSWGWGSTRELALFAIAIVGLVSFVRIELRRRVPMVDFSFFRARTFVGANVGGVHRQLRDALDVLLPRPIHAEHP